MKDSVKVLPNGPLPEVRKFYYDTAQAHHDGAIAALLKLIPVSQVMFGSDFPYRPGAESVTGLSERDFSRAERDAIDRGNALRLLPRLSSLSVGPG
jgi:predicted TIM-barrel fold metal-dependent hydrolase